MNDLRFNSTLSDESIAKNFENMDFFGGIMAGLEEALAYEKGSAKSTTTTRKRTLPNINCVKLRHSLNLTQKEFANILGVSSRTVESWEIGRSNPSPTAKNLLFLIQKNPLLIKDLI